jgi:hypothetical protein
VAGGDPLGGDPSGRVGLSAAIPIGELQITTPATCLLPLQP